jgi:Protein of unknown function (DUF3592)
MHKNWKDTDGTVESVEEYRTRSGTQCSVIFSYRVDGKWYGGTFTTVGSYCKDDRISVRYDPSKPDRNNLVQIANVIEVFGFLAYGLSLVSLPPARFYSFTFM